MGERRGTKALELWCRRITDGYPGVNVQNMTTSWRDGLAFCAMIHHFRPDLMDFNSLDKDDVYGNNELAFRTAEQHLGIPALLDAEDMASCSVPDRLSILTYLSQFYQTFGGSSPSRLAMKRTTEVPDERLASVPDSPQPKVAARLGARKEPCVVCGLPVFLAEKLVISRTLYHRTCFRCARCNNQLTLGNYYETEDGQYCCETCPDEEAAAAPAMHQEYNKTAMLATPGSQRSLSDEEKTTQYSSKSEASLYSTAIGFSTPGNKDLGVSEPSSQSSQMRLNFMASHLLSEKSDDSNSSSPLYTDTKEPQHPVNSATQSSDESDSVDSEASPLPTTSPSPLSELRFSPAPESQEFSENCAEESAQEKVSRDQENESVNNKLDNSVDNSLSVNQHHSATAPHDIDSRNVIFNENTKDIPTVAGNKVSESSQGLSLVQQRLRMFENNDTRAEKRDGACEQTNARRVIEKPNPIVHTSDNEEKEVDGEDERIYKPHVQTAETPQVAEVDATQHQEESDVQLEDTPENIVVSYESSKPLELPEGKEITAAVILQKMMENREARSDTSAVDTTLSNMSGVDLSVTEDYPEDLNPFQSDGNEDKEESEVRERADTKVSTNPFGSSDDENVGEEVDPPRPAARRSTQDKVKQSRVELPTKRRIEAPQISLNPFWSDEEGQGSDDDVHKPVPKPRTMKPTPEPSPVPRKASLDRGGLYASNTSISSFGSTTTPGGTYRKKKPAPKPPTPKELFSNGHTQGTPTLATPENSHIRPGLSPRTTPRVRKTKPAPPPPLSSSTPQNAEFTSSFSQQDTPILDVTEAHDDRALVWDDQKSNKDETNRNRQSLSIMSSSEEGQTYTAFPDKSAQGKWKRKKGPAPPRPTPHKRKIKVMSIQDVKLELDEIELQQQGLEKQGVRLEQLIRDKCETGSANEESSLTSDVEELMLELFSLVNEKNELFRRQAELMLLRRQQRLEEEHADIEYQIRCLMSQPEASKTDSDKQREELLIQRLVQIVEQRNEIVECLEMDRRREVEEDRSINTQMGLFAAKSKGDLTTANDDETRCSSNTKKEKIREKIKEKKSKKSHKKDADKDVDETEVKLKRHKKKWF